ncbi:hypothetical protein E2C01_084090 [Portunus trituberculatus]|uniref:Uncharacterized protein n=1 Tax=Portunus trituberculatus TaxID=210409 RepID=A0A5B7J5D5_PORTR|nr:hypothetical protein [Portunus trituberculatus]
MNSEQQQREAQTAVIMPETPFTTPILIKSLKRVIHPTDLTSLPSPPPAPRLFMQELAQVSGGALTCGLDRGVFIPMYSY